jgi:ABC-2 type transport system permease protein
MMALFGYTFGGELKEVRVAIVDLDKGFMNYSLAQGVTNQLGNGTTLKIVDLYGAGNDSMVQPTIDRVRHADLWAVIIFPENFTANVAASVNSMLHGAPYMPAEIQVQVDSTNPNIATAVVGEAHRAIQQMLVDKYHIVPPMTVQVIKVYGEGARFIDFFAPGIMGLAAMMVTFMLSIVSLVHERSTFTLDRALTTLVTEGEFVSGYALAFGILALIQSTVILLAAVLLFNIQIVGNALLVLLVIFLLGLGMLGLGFLLSAIAKSEFQAIQFLPLILFPSILLAGVFWPLEAVPDVLRPVSNFIPLTYAVDASRSIMIRGWGIENVWPQLLVLALFALAVLALSVYSLKRRG